MEPARPPPEVDDLHHPTAPQGINWEAASAESITWQLEVPKPTCGGRQASGHPCSRGGEDARHPVGPNRIPSRLSWRVDLVDAP